jgi:putative heme transporter
VIFLGGLFPIVGAIVSGTLAVLVALAHGGLVTALVVAALVIGVQQLESNLLQPLIVGRATRLHPLLVILAITAGALAAGVLGAFLAVPVAASIARTLDYLRTPHEHQHAARTATPPAPGHVDQPAGTAGPQPSRQREGDPHAG